MYFLGGFNHFQALKTHLHNFNRHLNFPDNTNVRDE